MTGRLSKYLFEEMRKINGILVTNTGRIPEVAAKNSDKTDEGLTYAKLLDKYRLGEAGTDFLKNLTLMAIRINDKPGGTKIANSYIQNL